jgi:hypothetical protein
VSSIFDRDIIWSDVVSHYAALSGVDAQVRADALAYANGALNVANMGPVTKRLARIYYAAHVGQIWMRVNDAATDNGEVSSETISGTSLTVSYADASSKESMSTTEAGRAFMSLARPLHRIPFATGGC